MKSNTDETLQTCISEVQIVRHRGTQTVEHTARQTDERTDGGTKTNR